MSTPQGSDATAVCAARDCGEARRTGYNDGRRTEVRTNLPTRLIAGAAIGWVVGCLVTAGISAQRAAQSPAPPPRTDQRPVSELTTADIGRQLEALAAVRTAEWFHLASLSVSALHEQKLSPTPTSLTRELRSRSFKRDEDSLTGTDYRPIRSTADLGCLDPAAITVSIQAGTHVASNAPPLPSPITYATKMEDWLERIFTAGSPAWLVAAGTIGGKECVQETNTGFDRRVWTPAGLQQASTSTKPGTTPLGVWSLDARSESDANRMAALVRELITRSRNRGR